MPQIFQVLRCYKCLVFQVHQAKKSNKWECKLCGEKQSVKRHYGFGIAKDCRMHVQKLNSMRGEKEELKHEQKLQNQKSDDSDEINTSEYEKVTNKPKAVIKTKWANYLEDKDLVEEVDNEPVYLGDAEVVLEIPKKRRKQFNVPKGNHTHIQHTTAASQNVDHSIEFSIKNTYKPSCYKPAEKESIKIADIKPIQDMPSEYFQPEIPSISSIEKENLNLNIPCKKIVLPVVNKNSKWAEYVEEDENEESGKTLSPDLSASQNDHMFSQCDDSELDSVLDF